MHASEHQGLFFLYDERDSSILSGGFGSFCMLKLFELVIRNLDKKFLLLVLKLNVYEGIHHENMNKIISALRGGLVHGYVESGMRFVHSKPIVDVWLVKI